MSAGIYRVPSPINEPVRGYAPRSPERESLTAVLGNHEPIDVACVVDGEHLRSAERLNIGMPCEHRTPVATVHLGDSAVVERAVAAAERARPAWAALPWEERAAVFLRAAALLTGPWRDRVNAATMLGQAKTCHQAEIDSACELIDFWRFNTWYAQQIVTEQPPISPTGTWNRLDHRPLDGFVLAITPFNFTSIAGNLPTAPAIMGNTVVWKPATTSAAACYVIMQLLEEAGLPKGVVNLVFGRGAEIGDSLARRPELAGLHFTGSTATFQHLWRVVSEGLPTARTYPRLVGETGGKDFVLAHPSADPVALSVAILRGAFEYQGQKCSAASRMYVPKSLWPEVRDRVAAGLAEMKVGDVRDFSTFLGAVIDRRAFEKHRGYLELGRAEAAETIGSGTCDDRVGWFVQPTLFRVDDPRHKLMVEEIFGPIATCFVYDDARWDDVLELVDTSTPYALTGAVFARDRHVVAHASERLRFAAGNFYINDKPTGAVVGQQPFGGSRASGTNDKAGSVLNLLRWTSPRAIKETFDPPRDWRYPFLG